jgi:hypothetical protein
MMGAGRFCVGAVAHLQTLSQCCARGKMTCRIFSTCRWILPSSGGAPRRSLAFASTPKEPAMSKKSLGTRLLAAAILVSVGATLTLMSQPSASPRSSPNQADHIFVPTMVAIQARDEEPAPTF